MSPCWWVRRIVPGQREPRSTWQEIPDPTRVAGLVAEALSLKVQEAELPIALRGSRCVDDALPVDRVSRRLLAPACSQVGHPLRELTQVTEFVVGVGSDHRFGFGVDEYSRRGLQYPLPVVGWGGAAGLDDGPRSPSSRGPPRRKPA